MQRAIRLIGFAALALQTVPGGDALARDLPLQASPVSLVLAAGEQWVAPEALFSAAEQALRQTRSAADPATRLELAMPPEGLRGLVLDAGALQIVAKPLAADIAWAPKMSVWVEVQRKGEVLRSVLVPVQVKAWQTGWVARRDLPAGAALNPDVLREEQVDVADGNGPAWHGAVIGRVLRAALLAGRYVNQSQTMLPRAVSRGEQVELIHRMGAVEVQAMAQALQDGQPGEHVQVRVSAAGGAVLARVVSAGKVELIR